MVILASLLLSSWYVHILNFRIFFPYRGCTDGSDGGISRIVFCKKKCVEVGENELKLKVYALWFISDHSNINVTAVRFLDICILYYSHLY